jgi:hypothetical protein
MDIRRTGAIENLEAVPQRAAANESQKPDRIWACYGNGGRCELCTRPIGVREIEYEVEWVMPGAVQVLCFHLSCYRQWEAGARNSVPRIGLR